MPLTRTVTMSTRSRGSKRARTQMRPSSTVRDEMSMGSAPSVRTVVSAVKERNGMTTQTAVGKATKRRYKVDLRDINALFCPLYKFRYDGFGFNNAITRNSGEDSGSVTYNEQTGVSTYSHTILRQPQGVWRSCEWSSGQQYWFETVALPFYKKMPNGSIRSVVELIEKYVDVAPNNALIQNMNLDAFYKAVETIVTPADGNADPTISRSDLLNSVNICYHGGNQTHKFHNFGTIDVHMELWELHPRDYMAGYRVYGVTAGGQNGYYTEPVWDDVVRDCIDNAPFSNLKSPFDDNRAYDEIHDIGTRIDNDSRRVMFKYKVSKPIRIKIAPGGTFTYVLKIPAFKVTGGEFLDYLVHYKSLDSGTSTLENSQREAVRPAWIPKFTRLLCGRMYAQKGFGLSSTGANNPTGNTDDTVYINAVGYGGGRVGHEMSEYHEMNLMPYTKYTTYSRVNYLDTTGITNFVDGGDDEIVNFDNPGVDNQQSSNELTDQNAMH